MRFLIQRVTEASVSIDGRTEGSVGRGYLILCGIAAGDTRETADRLVKKAVNLRIFEDAAGKTNLSIKDVGGGMLVVSQFTLYADCTHGNRPGFTSAGSPDMAKPLYEYIVSAFRSTGVPVSTGVFGADMKVSLVNDGPFTVMLDSDFI